MFRPLFKTAVALGVIKYAYDEGYNDGRSNRNYFFQSCNKLKENILQKAEDHLPPEHRADFRNDLNHAEHAMRRAHNEARESLGLGPR